MRESDGESLPKLLGIRLRAAKCELLVGATIYTYREAIVSSAAA
jgi:hypothetical protein